MSETDRNAVQEIIERPPTGLRVGPALAALSESGLVAGRIRRSENFLPAKHYLDIYERRVAFLRDHGSEIEPTLFGLLDDLAMRPNSLVALVTVRNPGTDVVLFVDRDGRVAAGFLRRDRKMDRP